MKTVVEFFSKDDRIIKEEYERNVSDDDLQLRASSLNWE